MKQSTPTRKKTAGFYLAMLTAILSLVAGPMFALGFHDSSYMNWTVVMLSVAAGGLYLLLSLIRLPAPLPATIMGLLNFAAFLIFIHSTYLIYSEIFFGGFSWDTILKADNLYYFACTFLFILNILFSNICVYKKPYRVEA